MIDHWFQWPFGLQGPPGIKVLLADIMDHFDRAPRGAALASLQLFGVATGVPFVDYLREFCVVVARNVEKDGPLALSVEMAIELARICTVQQFSSLMPTLFPGHLATKEISHMFLRPKLYV